ncbi:hypothetical protein [Desulfobacula phenolica]|uniref:hypothetical protein n=1 Tax=Desulfobacula phenolica TaxID=90732 RepID=UPI000B222F66|nr:hypothetical protein [Desulfobacula phenolica]
MKKYFLTAAAALFFIWPCHTMGFEFESFFKGLRQNMLSYLKAPDAKISLCYKLDQNHWTNFYLPPATDRVKIITTANIPKKADYDPDTPMKYALEYQICDKENNIIKSGIYHKHTKITLYNDAAGDKQYTAGYYLKTPLVPADGRSVVLDFKKIPDNQGLKMRFRLFGHDPIIFDVVMRLYLPETPSENNLKHQWQRTGKEKREHLSRFNIYPPEFLTQTEQINLMRMAWQPLAPLGSASKDYVLRKLYVRKEIDADIVQPPPFPTGLVIDQQLRVTVPIPEQGIQVKCVFSHVAPIVEGKPPAHIQLKWFGKKQKKQEWTVPWNGIFAVYENRLAGGIMELSSDQPVIVQVYSIDKGQKTDITPAPLVARAFAMDQENTLTYRVSHAKGLSTPFKAVFRKKTSDTISADQSIDYALLDHNGKQILKKNIPFDPVPSVYDHLIENDTRIILSDPVAVYFRLPPKVSSIRFSSSSPLLATAYNRPPQRMALTRVPEDGYASMDKEDEKQVSWFPITPLGFNTLFKLQRSVLLRLQHRPPDIDYDLSSGRFVWESFAPRGNSNDNGNGHYILTPAEKKQYHRDSALVSNFKKIPLNIPVTINFKSQGALKKMRPRLIFYSENRSRPFHIKAILDRKDYFQKDLAGLTGSVMLPPVQAGIHKLTLLSSAPVQCFVNLIRSEDAGYHLRFAYRLTRKSMTLDYTKLFDEDENLSLALFFPSMYHSGDQYGDQQSDQHSQRLVFTAKIQNLSFTDYGPFNTLTRRKRQYSLRPDNNEPAYILNSSTPLLRSRQSCFFPLRSDLKPGKYEISLTLEHGPDAYIVPYRVISGVYPERKILKEIK